MGNIGSYLTGTSTIHSIWTPLIRVFRILLEFVFGAHIYFRGGARAKESNHFDDMLERRIPLPPVSGHSEAHNEHEPLHGVVAYGELDNLRIGVVLDYLQYFQNWEDNLIRNRYLSIKRDACLFDIWDHFFHDYNNWKIHVRVSSLHHLDQEFLRKIGGGLELGNLGAHNLSSSRFWSSAIAMAWVTRDLGRVTRDVGGFR